MAHYAFLDQDNIVVQVIVGKDEGEDDIDWESHYSNFSGLRCLRTSYNTTGNVHLSGGVPFRKNYAGVGYYYSDEHDAFIPPRPYRSWNLNTNTFTWEPPVPRPDVGSMENPKFYRWNEALLDWVLQE